MGACMNYRVFKNQDKATIRRQWESMVDSDLFENGHSYSGSIGMLGRGEIKWHPTPARTLEEAEEVICNTHQKWSGPLAVRFDGGWVVGGWCSE